MHFVFVSLTFVPLPVFRSIVFVYVPTAHLPTNLPIYLRHNSCRTDVELPQLFAPSGALPDATQSQKGSQVLPLRFRFSHYRPTDRPGHYCNIIIFFVINFLIKFQNNCFSWWLYTMDLHLSVLGSRFPETKQEVTDRESSKGEPHPTPPFLGRHEARSAHLR